MYICIWSIEAEYDTYEYFSESTRLQDYLAFRRHQKFNVMDGNEFVIRFIVVLHSLQSKLCFLQTRYRSVLFFIYGIRAMAPSRKVCLASRDGLQLWNVMHDWLLGECKLKINIPQTTRYERRRFRRLNGKQNFRDGRRTPCTFPRELYQPRRMPCICSCILASRRPVKN